MATETPHPLFLLSLPGDVSSMLRELTLRLRALERAAGASALGDEFAPRVARPGELESDLLAATAALARAGPSDSHGW